MHMGAQAHMLMLTRPHTHIQRPAYPTCPPAGSIDQCRNVFLDNKPSPLPGLLRAFQHGSTSMGAAACQLLKVLASFEDSRQRVWKVRK
eukprot:364111-Chlamydomonas_euryale.AAC.3